MKTSPLRGDTVPEAARASWIRWGIGLSLVLPVIVAGVFLATSLMRVPLSTRHDVSPLLAVAIMSVFAIAVGVAPAWLLIARALRDAGPRSLLLGLAIEAASCVLCLVIAGIQNAANPREGGGGMAFVALGSAFGLTTVVFIPLALAAIARARLARAACRQPHT